MPLIAAAARLLALFLLVLPAARAAAADDGSRAFTNADIAALLGRLGTEVIGMEGQWRLVVGGRAVTVITDADHDRMRIMGHVTAADTLDEAALTRLLQANFDSALDARYAIARNVLWSVFVHPLGSLTEHDFLVGLGQVVNLANTFGERYTSGLLLFRGGDSGALRERELIDELLEKGLSI